jgi:hypothetical protein
VTGGDAVWPVGAILLRFRMPDDDTHPIRASPFSSAATVTGDGEHPGAVRRLVHRRDSEGSAAPRETGLAVILPARREIITCSSRLTYAVYAPRKLSIKELDHSLRQRVSTTAGGARRVTQV